ncbi:hypothetical protein BC835DRAFT_1377801, partial [Cytidiella melzeri]
MRKIDWQISIARVLVLTWCANTASGCSISVVNDAEARSSFMRDYWPVENSGSAPASAKNSIMSHDALTWPE